MLLKETIDDLDVSEWTAVLSLAWALRRKANERFLLSAAIEISPASAVNAVGAIDTALHAHELNDRYFLYFRRYVLAGNDGLAWFRACRAGAARLPEVEGGHALAPVTLLSEPPSSALMFPTTPTPGAVLPFSSGRRASLIPDLLGWEGGYWDETARRLALAWLREQAAFDFELDPEELGGAHLVVADPDLASVGVSPDLGPRSHGFGIRVEAEFRQVATSGFTFILHRHRPRGAEAPISFPLSGEHLIELPHEPETFAFDVVHERRGLVVQEPFACFLEGVTMEMEMVTRTREVEIAASAKRAADRYQVNLVNDPDVVRIVTGTRALTAAKLLAANYARRENRRPPYQQWFDGDVDSATKTLRELITSTKRSAWIIDPYLDETEIGRFALAVGRTSAPIKILTSAEGLKTNAKRHALPPGARLAARALSVAQGPAAQKNIEIRVMPGVRPEVHDRFLMIDEALWLLGSSLNEFGSRGTMLVAVPDPRAISRYIQQAWDRALPLQDWLAARPVRRINRWWLRWGSRARAYGKSLSTTQR